MLPFASLDYFYLPAPDFETAVRFYTDGLGGVLRWRVYDGGTWVAAVQITETGPLRDPAGQRLGIYERVRPQVEAAFEGRFDEG